MPTVYALVSDDLSQILDSNAELASGYKVFVYSAGSSTKATTYKDSDGAVANTNPIILNAAGRPPSGIYVESGTYKLVLAPDTDTDPPASAIRTRDDLTPINDVATPTAAEFSPGPTPTYVGATQFTVAGDQTTDFHVGRRVKTVNSGGTYYGYISASAYTSLTTVTVVLDSGSLDVGLSAVSLSFLSADDSSVPHVKSAAGGLTVTGTLTVSGALTASSTVAVDGIVTRGDIPVVNASGVLSQMAKGTEGKIIRYGANDPAPDDAIPQSAVVTPTSGTSVAITSIPAWVVRVTLTFNELITSGANEINIQIGDSGGLETTGYDALRIRLAADGSNVTSTHTTEFPLRDDSSASVSGVATLELHNPATNLWHYTFHGDRAGSNGFFHSGYKALSATLDRLSVLTTSTDTFVGNTGTVGIKWE